MYGSTGLFLTCAQVARNGPGFERVSHEQMLIGNNYGDDGNRWDN